MGWPTTDNPRTVFVTIRLTADEAAELDALASTLNTSRSEAVRDSVGRVVLAEQKRAARQKVQNDG